MKLSSMILSFALLAVLGLVNSLSVDFPASAKGDGYWVANATNTLNWRATSLKPKGTEKANVNPYATAYNHDGSSSTTTTNANGQTVNNDALNSANAAGNGTSSNSNAHQDAALHKVPAIRASVLIALVATGVALLA
ncbi:hypothetical protein CBOM_05889 [Ceraceosorus bombacis]|uniref:Uncharacterized protein n=1 Tax=Ceraceosorus bombacis TaxID=401625 RepID=A0A0P1BIT5_9BASI|nr:hypothetical protein CBOM_05889 [Ceraceosorus bombacis]